MTSGDGYRRFSRLSREAARYFQIRRNVQSDFSSHRREMAIGSSMALIYAVTAEETVRVRTGGRARAWQGGPPRLILGRQMHRRQCRPPFSRDLSVSSCLSVCLPVPTFPYVCVCVCARGTVHLSRCLSKLNCAVRSPSTTPLHSLFGFCQRSLTVTLVDSYCSSLRSPPLPPCQPGPICCGGDDGRRGGRRRRVMGQGHCNKIHFPVFDRGDDVCVAQCLPHCLCLSLSAAWLDQVF